ncbi:hypothetical protein RGU12_00520 [Fredinandcohnia sp. QZ13]|uniref:hypothetical protein n=1 Tax=Fredinandcohnia sp. QZ13 TaxID=3073144 RepID=UPI002853489E|nr:hypothetical protein [Fredinandcohnia sp. QZ13]MDR4886026.1 hypothetical protein [Fredinandcohnia sp. QZ13]
MNLKNISILTKFLIGLLGFSLLISFGRGAITFYDGALAFWEFDYHQLVMTESILVANLSDLFYSISFFSVLFLLLIHALLIYLFFTGKKVFIPLFLLTNFFAVLITFILSSITNILTEEYLEYTETYISIVISIFWLVFFLLSNEARSLFSNELKRKKYIKLTEEEYNNLLKNKNSVNRTL